MRNDSAELSNSWEGHGLDVPTSVVPVYFYLTLPSLPSSFWYRWVSPLVLVLIFSVHWSFLVLMYWYWYWYWSSFQVLTLYWYWSRKYWVNQYQYQNEEKSKKSSKKIGGNGVFQNTSYFSFQIEISNWKSSKLLYKIWISRMKTDSSLKKLKFCGVSTQYS